MKFAGQQFSVERERTSNDKRKEGRLAKNKVGGSKFSELDELVQQIEDQDKNVNCIAKSRIDWDNYTKGSAMEKELMQNRKDGFIAKKKFIEKVNDTEYANKRNVERMQQASANASLRNSTKHA